MSSVISPCFWGYAAEDVLHHQVDRAVPEMRMLSEAYGLNFLEWRDVEHYYEGMKPYHVEHDEIEMITKFENEHIAPYIWMIEKHYSRIKEKIKEGVHAKEITA